MEDCDGRREMLLTGIENYPIVYASVHGVYDLREDLVDPVVVPQNVIVFEVADIGEVTLTSIDPLLWNVIQNRELFRDLISGDLIDPIYSNMLRALHVYMPGDTLYKRTLLYEPDNFLDNKWAFYRFEAGITGIPFPKNHLTTEAATAELTLPVFQQVSDPFLQGVKSHLYKVERTKGPILRSGSIASGRNESYSQLNFIDDCIKKYGKAPTIYIISACASLFLDTKKVSREERIKDHILSENQRSVDLKNYLCGIQTLAYQGDGGESVALPASVGVEAPRLRSKAPRWLEEFVPPSAYSGSSNPVTGNTPEAQEVLLSTNVSRPPRLGNFKGDKVALFEKVDGNYIPVLTSDSRVNWSRVNAEKKAEGYPSGRLYTLGRDKTGIPKFTPFTKKGGGRRTRRFLKKSMKTRKYTIRSIKKTL